MPRNAVNKSPSSSKERVFLALEWKTRYFIQNNIKCIYELGNNLKFKPLSPEDNTLFFFLNTCQTMYYIIYRRHHYQHYITYNNNHNNNNIKKKKKRRRRWNALLCDDDNNVFWRATFCPFVWTQCERVWSGNLVWQFIFIYTSYVII